MFYIRAHHRADANLWSIEVWSILVSHFLLQLLCSHFDLILQPSPKGDSAMTLLHQLVLFVNLFESLCKYLLDLWEHQISPWLTGRPRGPQRWWAWWAMPAMQELPLHMLIRVWGVLLCAVGILWMIIDETSSIRFDPHCAIVDPPSMSVPLCHTYSHLLIFVLYIILRFYSAFILQNVLAICELLVAALL